MAKYEDELHKLMLSFAPRQGFGIPNIGAERNRLADLFATGERQAVGRDIQGFQSLGGTQRHVSQAFAPGFRKFQFSKQLQDALTDLMSRHGDLSERQRQSLMGILSPIAHERANRPSWISTLLGGALGIGAQVAIPGLGGKIFGNQLQPLLDQMMGGGGGSGAPRSGGGYGAYGQQFPQFKIPTGQFDG